MNGVNKFFLVVGFMTLHAFIPAGAQSGSSVADIALYEGADRQQRLLAGAKKEGSLTFYTSIAEKDMEKITTDFQKRYGIKLNVWRAGTNKVVQRATTEAQANRFEFDAVHVGSPEMEALHREKLLQQVRSPHFKDLIPLALPEHQEWVSTLLSVWVQAYNTQKIKKDELPKTYEDLLKPRWKGQLGIESKNQEWFSAVVQGMGEEKGLKFFRDLVARNGISVRVGHSLLNNMVVSGEVPLALTVYNYMPEQAKEKGAPIDWFAIPPAIARANGIGVSRKAPHPHAALLFYDYMISDAQKLLVEMNYVPINKKVPSPMKNTPIKMVDPKTTLDEYEKWGKLFEDVVLRSKQP